MTIKAHMSNTSNTTTGIGIEVYKAYHEALAELEPLVQRVIDEQLTTKTAREASKGCTSIGIVIRYEQFKEVSYSTFLMILSEKLSEQHISLSDACYVTTFDTANGYTHQLQFTLSWGSPKKILVR